MRQYLKSTFIVLFAMMFNSLSAQYEPFINNPVINPAPFKFIGQTGTISLNVGNNGRCAMDRFTEDPCQDNDCKFVIKICLNRSASLNTIEPESGTNPINAINDIGGTSKTKFSWTYYNSGTDENCFIGIQIASIPAFSSGSIVINIRFTQPSNSSNPLDGFKANIIPTYYAQGAVSNDPCGPNLVGGNNVGNDLISIYTFLPLQLTNFNVKYLGNGKSKLEWTTLNENNSLKFEIERKFDSESGWTTLGTIPAALHSSEQKIYNYTDGFSKSGNKIFYRIKQVDQDGSAKYTDIKSIQLNYSNMQIEGYPNPTKNQYRLQIQSKKDEKISLDVIDIMGRIISREEFIIQEGSNTKNLQLGSLVPGTYFVKVAGKETNESLTVLKID